MRIHERIVAEQKRMERSGFFAGVRHRWLTYAVILLIAVFSLLVSQVPFINLIISPPIALSFAVLIAVLLLKWTAKTVFLICLAMFAGAAVMSVFGKEDISELLGTISYFLLWIAGVLLMREFGDNSH